MANLLIIGASRGIGRQAVEMGLASGHSVRAFARSADSIAFDDPALEKRQGDALSPDDLEPALDGVDAVIQTLGLSLRPSLITGPVRLFSHATHCLVAAMNKAKVSRLIAVTGFGAGSSRDSMGCVARIPFRLLLGRAYDDKSTQESLIEESELRWTIVRPAILTNGPLTGRYRVLEDPKSWRNGVISRADVADFLVRQVDDTSLIGKGPVLTY